MQILRNMKKRVYADFLGNSESIFITTEIMEKTIQIRKKYKMKLPDAIIAASAIVNDVSLITADQEFRKINELKLELLIPRASSCSP